MSQPEEQRGEFPPDFEALLRPMVEFWSSCCEQAAAGEGGPAAAGEAGSSRDAWRREWLEAASRSMEAYLRSPMFLAVMKQHIDDLIQAKRGGRDPAAPEPPADTPAAADTPAPDPFAPDPFALDPLTRRLEALQQELSGKLSGVEQRLQEIQRRLPGQAADPSADGRQAAPPAEPGDDRSP